ncbi:hypothetical protein TPHA_0A04250 [Tetrapisispora phaffii CBS 4417]|uniref:Reverse transcriptase domain-containing protein n=1 Tax=Tetrapisispora phaffii (strain ATCC 24235 / CBS 4417 / NBRC 1672 / NRRL Y-8282 / UCD 70-5) TaxID=1071381 RepID=G8BNM2_TETPH|nr:LOW QUALITY PROTEIN: hypothetical protein TPHA_0A04250 [Tetrapisispora phaffii CBS 4417]CCE61500.1 hypothetical protein TPHA_0A04250 [Tetrapisispora phaffii CBS 4417]
MLSDFEKRFRKYTDPNKVLNSINQLSEARLGIEKLNSEFRRLWKMMPPDHWTEKGAMAIYMRLFNQNTYHLVLIHSPQSLTKMMDAAYETIAITGRFAEPSRLDAPRYDNDGDYLMAAIQSRTKNPSARTIRNATREDCRRLNLCFYCKKPGHRLSECKKRLARNNAVLATMRVLDQSKKSDEVYNSSKTLYLIINTILNPVVGTTLTTQLTVQGTQLNVLLDSGSPTSFIRKDVVQKLNLPYHEVSPFSFKGFTSNEIKHTSLAAQIPVSTANQVISISAYIMNHMEHDLLIGNPILDKYPILKEGPRIASVKSAKFVKYESPKSVKSAKFVKSESLKPAKEAKSEMLEYTNPEPAEILKPVESIMARQSEIAEEAQEQHLNTISEPNLDNAILNNPGLVSDIETATMMACIKKVSQSEDMDSFNKLPNVLIRKYSEIVRNDLPPKPPLSKHTTTHEITIKENARLPRLQPYRLTPRLQMELNTIIDDLLEKKFILPSKSPCSSPIVLLKKKDDTYRLCVDYRALNKATIADPFPLPRIDDLLSRIGDASVFSTLDLHSGYHQIPMNKDDQYKTAFVTPSGKYEYTVMPFGLVNAPSTFARHMSDLFRGLTFVCVYLDDILIFSDSKETHWEHLDTVLGRLLKENLIVKKKKCTFTSAEVEFLGYQIGANKITPIVTKCQAIDKFPTPKSVKEAQRFLGMINYYRRFIPNCSKIVTPIQQYICKESVWSTTQDDAFRSLKSALTSDPLLAPFKPNGDYRLTTDASKEGVGAVLKK